MMTVIQRQTLGPDGTQRQDSLQLRNCATLYVSDCQMQYIRDRIEQEKAERLKNEWTRVIWRDKCMRCHAPMFDASEPVKQVIHDN